MMMPSQPTSHLVMIHPDFAFGLFENKFDRPSHSANPHKLLQRHADRRIAEIVFDPGGILQIATNDQPELTGRQATAQFGHAQKCEITDDRPFTAFLDNSSNPILFLNLLHQILDRNGMLPGIAQTQTSRMTPMTTPGRNIHFWWDAPDQSILFDGGEIPLSGRSHTVPKGGAVSIQGVCRHPGKRQIIAFYRIFQQFQPDFRLRFENQIFGYATNLPLLGLFFLQPLFGHEQLPSIKL